MRWKEKAIKSGENFKNRQGKGRWVAEEKRQTMLSTRGYNKKGGKKGGGGGQQIETTKREGIRNRLNKKQR